jgi:hypothetical protein
MRTFILLVVVVVPGLGRGDEPPAALPPGYDAAYHRCQETGKAMIVWVNVKGRVLPGAVGLECRTFPGVSRAGIVVGVWKGDTLLRHDLPADAADAVITALYPTVRDGGGTPPPVRVFRFVPTGWPGGVCVGGT